MLSNWSITHNVADGISHYARDGSNVYFTVNHDEPSIVYGSMNGTDADIFSDYDFAGSLERHGIPKIELYVMFNGRELDDHMNNESLLIDESFS